MAVDAAMQAADATVVSSKAHVTVAQTMGMEPPPLGLDRPLALLGGGDRLFPLGMASASGIDRVPGLRAFVAEACRRSAAAGGDAYRQPPLALLGERGVGKGLVAAWIARHAGVPLYRVRIGGDAEHVGLGRRMDAAAQSWPAFPIVAMAASRCANPLVVVELDVDRPPSAEAEEVLVSMIDPRRASRWTDDTTGSIVHLGHVSWLLEVHGRPRRRGGWHDRDGNTVAPPPPFRPASKRWSAKPAPSSKWMLEPKERTCGGWTSPRASARPREWVSRRQSRLSSRRCSGCRARRARICHVSSWCGTPPT